MRCYPFLAAFNATRFLLNHKLYQDVEIITVYIHNEITFTERLSSERERERERERKRERERERKREHLPFTYRIDSRY